MSEFNHLSGIAGEIRSATESEQFDLAGYTETRIKDLIHSAFTTPLQHAKQMIRFTFIVGGGKLVRSRYDDELFRWMTQSLREIGFKEDKSAAETFDSQGSYKHQHDTGQNLKYVIVYPFVEAANTKTTESPLPSILDESSPEYIVTVCEMAIFNEIVQNKTPSWRQKKRLLMVLQESYDRHQAIENKLVAGSLLTSDEQNLYDINPGNSQEKLLMLQSEIKKHVDSGQLTESEKKELLASIDRNIHELNDSLKDKKLPKIEEKLNSLIARKLIVEKINPIKYKLKFAEEILKSRVKIFPLIALEEKGRSMSLTLADLKLLEGKSELEENISKLESASRGWFEDEDDFKLKCDALVAEAKSIYAKKQLSAKSTNNAVKSVPSRSVGSTGWSTVGSAYKSTVSKSSAVAKKSSPYAAAFDDDSD